MKIQLFKLFNILIIALIDGSNQFCRLIIGEKEIYQPVQSVQTVNIHVEAWSVQQASNVAGVDSP